MFRINAPKFASVYLKILAIIVGFLCLIPPWRAAFDLVFFPFDPSSIDLGITTRLQSLRLSCVHHAGNQPVHLLWISQALRGIRAHNNLEELVLNLTCDQLEVTLDANWIEAEEWALEFDSLMTSPGFDHLHRVAVFVDLFDANNPYPLRLDDNARVIEGLEELLPLLQDTGLLSVQWVINELEGRHGTLELQGILDSKQARGVHIPLNAQKSPEPVWYCAED
ncbi:hypothetical protein Hypma_003775 [Hypsizygus marmoreus]|uniref:Uncharacterized protein n=1 Tax=Hypsizygus marmoreus TaxID=39966 RepID=A0A369K9M4_HYPMA|nr:hypothetical protein Hypma_003775 [Hypsizygus marmoreus]